MPNVELPQAKFKVVMLGDTNAGKTSIVLRFAEGYYRDAARSSTSGAFFITKRIQTSNGTTCKIQIWDTAGQRQFRAMAPMYYKTAAAAIVCYDVSSDKSFHVMREWLDELHRNISAGSIVIAIAATKCDLIHNFKPAVPISDVEDLAQAMGAIFVDTSAKENIRISELFQCVAERVLSFRELGRNVLPITAGASVNSQGEIINGDVKKACESYEKRTYDRRGSSSSIISAAGRELLTIYNNGMANYNNTSGQMKQEEQSPIKHKMDKISINDEESSNNTNPTVQSNTSSHRNQTLAPQQQQQQQKHSYVMCGSQSASTLSLCGVSTTPILCGISKNENDKSYCVIS